MAKPVPLRAILLPAEPSPPRPIEAASAYYHHPEMILIDEGSEHNVYIGFASSLQGGGLFVATYCPRAIGDRVEMAFRIAPLNVSYMTVFEVEWVREFNREFPDVVPGMGLRLLDMKDESREALEAFLWIRDPIFYPG